MGSKISNMNILDTMIKGLNLNLHLKGAPRGLDRTPQAQSPLQGLGIEKNLRLI